MFLVDNKTSELYSQVNSTGKEIRIPMSAGIAGLVATSGAPVLIPEAYKDSRFNKSVDLKTGFQTRNILCVPIKTRSGFVLGVAQLINKGEGGVISGSSSRNRSRTGTEGGVAGVDGTDGPGGAAGGDGAEELVTFTGDDQRFLEVFASQVSEGHQASSICHPIATTTHGPPTATTTTTTTTATRRRQPSTVRVCSNRSRPLRRPLRQRLRRRLYRLPTKLRAPPRRKVHLGVAPPTPIQCRSSTLAYRACTTSNVAQKPPRRSRRST